MEDLSCLRIGNYGCFRLINGRSISGTIEVIETEGGGKRIALKGRAGFISSIEVAVIMEHRRPPEPQLPIQRKLIITLCCGVAGVHQCPPDVMGEIVDFANGDELVL